MVNYYHNKTTSTISINYLNLKDQSIRIRIVVIARYCHQASDHLEINYLIIITTWVVVIYQGVITYQGLSWVVWIVIMVINVVDNWPNIVLVIVNW